MIDNDNKYGHDKNSNDDDSNEGDDGNNANNNDDQLRDNFGNENIDDVEH